MYALYVACCISFMHRTSFVSDFQILFLGHILSPPAPTDANGFVYFASSSVFKLATGNDNGPSTTAPSIINSIDFPTGNAYDGAVRLGEMSCVKEGCHVRREKPLVSAAPTYMPSSYVHPNSSLLLQVDKDGNGFWPLDNGKVGKTNGNAGSAPMVRARESSQTSRCISK